MTTPVVLPTREQEVEGRGNKARHCDFNQLVIATTKICTQLLSGLCFTTTKYESLFKYLWFALHSIHLHTLSLWVVIATYVTGPAATEVINQKSKPIKDEGHDQ